jgi:hypothetical protein
MPKRSRTPPEHDHGFAARLLGMILAVWIAALAIVIAAARLSPEDSGTVVVVFPLGVPQTVAVRLSSAAGAKVLATSWFEPILLVTDDRPGFAGRLHAQGAIGVFRNISVGSLSFAGCIGAVPTRITGVGAGLNH